MAAGVEHAFCAKGLCNFGIVLGVAHHHAGSRGDAALCKPLFAHLHFAYAIDVCKAEQLSKIALQAPCGYQSRARLEAVCPNVIDDLAQLPQLLEAL